MPSTTPGHIKLDGVDYVIVEEAYTKQLQTPFSPRFSTGDPSLGDLSFFQFIAMEDFSGGNGQEIFSVTNRFLDSEGIDVTTPGELKLAPKIEKLAEVNGPQHEHLNEPVEDEDGWPQVIEWLGRAIIYNDRIEYDAGGVEFLEVFETEVSKDKVINRDTSGTSGVITNDTRAEILDIEKISGLPGDLVKVTVKFTNPRFAVIVPPNGTSTSYPKNTDPTFKLQFRLDVGGESEKKSESFTIETREISSALASFSAGSFVGGTANQLATINSIFTVDFTLRVPNKEPGIYKLWTSCTAVPTTPGGQSSSGSFDIVLSLILETILNADGFADGSTNANVLFFIESVSEVIVDRKNLYAPQLKAATVVGDKLVGGRVYDGKGYVEVYQVQNDAIDRTMQIDLTAVSSIPAPPSYMELIGHNDVIVAAFDNKIYKIDIETSGLTDAQRITLLGTVPGDYVSGMEVWNQRVYIGSFDKSKFTSAISWTNLEVIQGSYSIDGKFWITALSNFNGGLFYSGGNQDGVGKVMLFPAETILEFEHPEFDNRIRSLNAGRKLYAGWSHGSGLAVITERGASTWARVDLGEEATNVVWDIEEVGDTVFMLMNSGFFKTTNRYISKGFLETSEIGGNTPLIDKDWSSVTVEIKEKLLGGQKIRVLATNSEFKDSFFLLGEIDSTSELETAMSFPDTFDSQWVKLLIELSTDDETKTPIIKRISIKYVPSSLQKLQWGIGVRADSNIKLLNGSTEKRSGAEIMSDLFGLRTKGRIKFVDIDEEEYDVTIADIKQTNPIVNKKDLEGLVTIELLEL